MRRGALSASVDEGLVHVEDQGDFLFVDFLLDGVWDDEGVLFLSQGIEIVFDLG